MKTIYNLELHETLIVNENIQILRVAGGWLYTLPGKQPIKVDYNSEFKELQKRIRFEEIVKYVEQYYLLPVSIKEAKTKEGNYPIAKQMICKIASKHTVLSTKEMALRLNYKNGSSTSNAIKKLNDLMSVNTNFINEYNDILKGLNLN